MKKRGQCHKYVCDRDKPRKAGIMTRVKRLGNTRSLRMADESRAKQNSRPLLRKSHVHIWMAREHHSSPGNVPVLKK